MCRNKFYLSQKVWNIYELKNTKFGVQKYRLNGKVDNGFLWVVFGRYRTFLWDATIFYYKHFRSKAFMVTVCTLEKLLDYHKPQSLLNNKKSGYSLRSSGKCKFISKFIIWEKRCISECNRIIFRLEECFGSTKNNSP